MICAKKKLCVILTVIIIHKQLYTNTHRKYFIFTSEWHVVSNSSVVDEYVCAPERVPGPLDDALHVLLLGDVTLHRVHLALAALKFRGQHLRRFHAINPDPDVRV